MVRITRRAAIDDLGRIYKIYPKGIGRLPKGNFELKDGPYVTGIYHIEMRTFTGWEAEEILEREATHNKG